MLTDGLEELWTDFARSLRRRGRAEQTVGIYRQSYERFWRWALDAEVAEDPADVTHDVLNKFGDHLLSAEAMRNGKPLGRPIAATTRRILWQNLRPFFAWYSKDFDAANPFDKADAPPGPQAEPVPVVHLDDLRALLAACAGRDFSARRDDTLIRVLVDTGARLGELVNLRVDDWDRRSDVLRLDGKTGKRVVPLSTSTGEALSRYMRARRTHSKTQLDNLWLAPRGALTGSGVAQILKRRCEAAGIAAIHPHQLRHTWAHEFRNVGGSEGDLLVLAGWTSAEMAHRYGKSAAAARAQDAGRKYGLGDRL